MDSARLRLAARRPTESACLRVDSAPIHKHVFQRPALILALVGLLLSHALPVAAQDGYAAPAASGAGAPAQPPEKPPAPKGAEPRKRVNYPVSKRVSRYLATALKQMQANQLAEAEQTLEKIAGNRTLNPGERAKVQQFLGNVSVYKSDPTGAVKHLNEALRVDGLDPASEQQVIFQLASLYTQMSDFPNAKEVLDRWFQAAEQPSPEAFYLNAVILIQMERFPDAVVSAEQAVALTPNPRESWLSLLAHTYYLVKDYAKMASTLETLIERFPTKKSYWMLLSAAYFDLDRDAEARAIVQLAYRQGLLDQDREIRALTRLLLANGLPYEAAAVLEKGMTDAVIPKQEDSYELLTNAFLQAREEDRALVPLTQGAEVAEDAQLHILLGKVQLKRDHFAEAVVALNQGLAKAKPDQRGRIYLLIGVAQLGANRLDDAERAFRSARADEKTRTEADSYLKFVAQERERRQGLGA